MTTLLELPSELRNQIWELVFKNQQVTPEAPSDLRHTACTPCAAQIPSQYPSLHNEISSQLLTCRKVYDEAHSMLHKTFTLHVASAHTLQRVHKSSPPLRNYVHRLTLTLHFDEENRMEWISTLSNLATIFPNLRQLVVHNHMRPPTSYENLVDGIFLAAPLATLPQSITQTLHFDYVVEDVMFASPFLGEIRCSDALEEHELVIRDLLSDEVFKRAAQSRDLNHMTAVLLRVARAHEQPWFAKLQRRRLKELNRQSQVQGQSEGLGPGPGPGSGTSEGA